MIASLKISFTVRARENLKLHTALLIIYSYNWRHYKSELVAHYENLLVADVLPS